MLTDSCLELERRLPVQVMVAQAIKNSTADEMSM